MHLFSLIIRAFASALMSYTNTYEDLNLPLYLDGVDRAFDDLAVHDRVLQVSQQYLFTSQYRPANVGNLIGIVFEHAEVIPGLVPPETPRVASAQVPINGSYSRDVAAEYSDQSRVVRPTGYFVPAGELITLSVDPGVVGHGLSIIVGHHFRNMDYEELGVTNRFPDISVEYPLDQSVINVISPFGGGLYVKVLEGTAAGVFDLTINNAVMSPYFSWRAGQQTAVADWLAQVSASGAPWADFESDKVHVHRSGGRAGRGRQPGCHHDSLGCHHGRCAQRGRPAAEPTARRVLHLRYPAGHACLRSRLSHGNTLWWSCEIRNPGIRSRC